MYSYVKTLIESRINDDVFPLKDAFVEISSSDFHWGDGTKLSPEATLEFRAFDGYYRVIYYWQVENKEEDTSGKVVGTFENSGGILGKAF